MSNGEIPRSLSARGGWLDDRLHAAQSLNRFMIILGGAAIWLTGARLRAQRGRAQWRRAPGSGALAIDGWPPVTPASATSR
jgi:hypothetical protein